MVIGFFGDRFGRKRCGLVLSIVMSAVIILLELMQLRIFNLSTMTKYVIYMIGQFIIGAVAKAIYLILYILLIEV
jgi:hypothetical protein